MNFLFFGLLKICEAGLYLDRMFLAKEFCLININKKERQRIVKEFKKKKEIIMSFECNMNKMTAKEKFTSNFFNYTQFIFIFFIFEKYTIIFFYF